MALVKLEDLLDTGAHFGHVTRKWHPNYKPYVLMEKNGVHIINLDETISAFKKATEFIKSIVKNNGEILFIDSIYNGEYKISGVTSETFNISPKVPEFLRYSQSDCEKLEYSTKSKNVIGTIKEFRILSSGYNYKKLPLFNTISSTNGTGANIKITSNDIGKINKNQTSIDFCIR